MLRVIAVRTGTKYSQWYVDNLKNMIDNYSNLKYDRFEVLTENNYETVFNKLNMFKYFKDGQNIYFDLDVLIKGDCNHLLRNHLTTCHAWWRKKYHTPLNSSVISWSGDFSYIYDFFNKDPEYYMLKYSKGLDQFLYENFKIHRYQKFDGINSFSYLKSDYENFKIILFNQTKEIMHQEGWWSSYFLQQSQQQI